MKGDWTRRKFLQRALKSSIVAGGAVTGGVIAPAKAHPGYTAEQNPSLFDTQQREILRVAMDEIIPAGDGMPAASEVGGEEYLIRIARENPKIETELKNSLRTLTDLSRKLFDKEFTSLAHAERVEALKKFEALRPSQNFVKLRDYVYEAYYTQPKVWKLLGYPFYPTNGPGPQMKSFDPSSLDRVRNMTKLYREVP